MSTLTKTAKQSIRKQAFENYSIAIVCSIVLGNMFGVAV